MLYVGVVVFQISLLDLGNPTKESNGIKQLAKMWVIPISRAFAEHSTIKDQSYMERLSTKKMLKFVKAKGEVRQVWLQGTQLNLCAGCAHNTI